ncbi:LysR family transcriptional regulator [Methylobacterium sp. B4]|uniref:LysR family transcriptional regulator n=1 Tax=Methylobacterium sp. B4 TaxID=1938755 RepID=UPI000D762809|nr:LysR family transcriptional regulator [Methylobacterium sp. B4]PXW61467.1 LysR family transcriptional regulator [Methylobacterium sp. B4]
MDVDDLRTFVEVADAGGVSAASRRLNLAKSIVSRRLLRLEAELGTQLLARTTRGAALTEAGTTFREHAARVCAEVDAAMEAISVGGELRGLLRVAVPSTFGPTHFAPAIAELTRRHPQLQINCRYSDRYVDLVTEGFDCGIRVGYLADSNLVARRIGSFSVRLFASPDYIAKRGVPEKPEDVPGHPAVMIGTETWTFSAGGKSFPVRPTGRFRADSAVAIAEATAAGAGITALPDVIAEPYVAAGSLVPIMLGYALPSIGMFVVRPPGQHPSRKVQALTELLIERLGR